MVFALPLQALSESCVPGPNSAAIQHEPSHGSRTGAVPPFIANFHYITLTTSTSSPTALPGPTTLLVTTPSWPNLSPTRGTQETSWPDHPRRLDYLGLKTEDRRCSVVCVVHVHGGEDRIVAALESLCQLLCRLTGDSGGNLLSDTV